MGPVPPPPPSGTGLRPDAVHMPRRAPAAPPPSRPHLAARSPRRLAGRLASASAIKTFLARRGVSVVEIAEATEESPAVVHDRLTGEKPLPVDWITAIPQQRIRDALWDLLRDINIHSAAA
jgi:hypothetical protein